jgi:transcriptional regulator with XRE-family HTH domain
MLSHNVAFGRAVRALRKARKITQRTLAIEARLDRTYISLLELGESSPTLDTMLALCRGLDVTFPELAAAVAGEIVAIRPKPTTR